MSQFTIRLTIEPYLKKYLLAISSNKVEPIRFKNKSEYNRLLEKLISKHGRILPPSKKDNTVEIELPYFMSKDVRSYNKLSVISENILREIIRNDFRLDLWLFLSKNLTTGCDRKHLIQVFLDTFNITEDDIKSESIYRSISRQLQKRREQKIMPLLVQKRGVFF